MRIVKGQKKCSDEGCCDFGTHDEFNINKQVTSECAYANDVFTTTGPQQLIL